MRCKLVVSALAVSIWAASLPATASGILTADVLNTAQLVVNAMEQAGQASAALETAKTAIETAKTIQSENKGLITGNDKLSKFLDNPAINKVMPLTGWGDVYSQVKDINTLRKRWGLMSTDSKMQASYDQLLAIADALERNYKASAERVTNAEALRDKLDQVQTPQEKQDLALRYQQELLEQQNQRAMLDNMSMLVAQRQKAENKRRVQEFRDHINGTKTTTDE